jgi:uncharacterized protein (DUF1697 family)
MAELRLLAEELGLEKVRTYIQSGNLLFRASGSAASLETRLEGAIMERFGLEVPVIIRSAEQWRVLREQNPFREAAEKEPNRLMLLISKKTPATDAAPALQDRARDGELIEQAGEALWIHFPSGAGTSRLSPSLIDRLAGSPTTARNYRTVVKLQQMLSE